MQTVNGILEQYKKSPKEFPLLQEEAIQHFSRLGFPTTKNEEWRYTNISPILNKDFSFLISDLKISKEEILKKFSASTFHRTILQKRLSIHRWKFLQMKILLLNIVCCKMKMKNLFISTERMSTSRQIQNLNQLPLHWEEIFIATSCI